MAAWQFWIDRGGTFTDVVARRGDGVEVSTKLLSECPERYEDAALEGMRRLLAAHNSNFADVAAVRLGTTVATNALLERKGARVVLAVTAGFADALEIGHQARPHIFALNIVKPDLLHSRVIEIRERVTAAGEVLAPLDESQARRDLSLAFDDGFRAVAIACVHGWAYPAHERRLSEIARAIGYTQVSTGSEISGLMKFIPRTDTTVADAYLSPVLRDYVERFTAAFQRAGGKRETQILFMQSNGGLSTAQQFRGRDAVLSGPAGGVVGMATAAARASFENALGFDMGGTSTDVSHFAGVLERTHETVIAGVRLAAPMMDVHTIAAGGGSICTFDGARMRVGPSSAGADPGPACYRRGGPLTITDCNVLLGRIRPEFFPAIFGPHSDLPLDRDIVDQKFAVLCNEIARATGHALSPFEAAEGFLRIADLAMAEAIKKISIQRGYNPSDYVLVAFGGAGGQHACAVAEAAGVGSILLHPLAGVLSAWGIGHADVRRIAEETIETPLQNAPDLVARSAALKSRIALNEHSTDIRVIVHLKYDGGDFTLPLNFEPDSDLSAAFASEHMKRFGFIDPARAIVVGSLSVEAVQRLNPATPAPSISPPKSKDVAPQIIDLIVGAAVHAAPAYRRTDLPAGFEGAGPAIIVEDGATTYVAPGWRARMTDQGDLLLTRAGHVSPEIVDERVDPVLLEVFNNRFMGVAEEMGLALQTTASSVNIKERLDFSCAIFDAAGGLVANAPHIPVHLGSMGESVREILRRRAGTLRRGDVYMLNAPHAGGTHLPDITVIAPVFINDGEAPAFFTAARGHHADIGGLTPGSMPARSSRIEDEGILIEDCLLVENGRLREAEIRSLLSAGPHPARDVERNIADLRAQIAACRRGAEELGRLVRQFGAAGVIAYMNHVQDNAEEHVRRVIAGMAPGAFSAPMDNGAVINVSLTPDTRQRTLRIDFTGTSAQQSDNFNAPLAITRAAVLYVFRTLIDDAIPLNEGCLRPIEIIAPEGSILNPARGAAVVAGNVETSQVIVDALFGALGRLAASQGTMNNLTFGDASRQYYETICGGAGAGPGFDGACAVQTNMTNSRLTDPEVLETRFPVLVEQFSVRRGSGGRGRFTGGDGTVRRIRFQAPMTAVILSNRRRTTPFGLAGGGAGLPGANRIERTTGAVTELAATGETKVAPGDVIVIETPGGGGYGAA